MFYTYILHSNFLNGYYIGNTGTTLIERLTKHLSSKKGYTSKAKDWVVVYSESFTTKADAMLREKEIKN